MNILVSGASSGLGRTIHERLGGSTWLRAASRIAGSDPPFDAIVHCAFKASQQISRDTFAQHLEETSGLAERLLSIPHGLFIFISSVDVYPAGMERCDEDAEFDANSVTRLYGMAKLAVESVVLRRACQALILRCTSLLGPYTRSASTIVRLAREEAPVLTLTADSRLNVVAHEDVAGFVAHAIAIGLYGTYNVASAEPLTVGEIARLLESRPQFGSYRYDVGNIDNSKAAALFAPFRRSSADVVRAYAAAQVHGQRHE